MKTQNFDSKSLKVKGKYFTFSRAYPLKFRKENFPDNRGQKYWNK